MNFEIAVIPGDGVGPEIMEEAVRVLKKIGKVYGHDFQITEVIAGTAAVDQGKEPFPEESLEICRNADAVLLGKLALGKHPKLEFYRRPESILSVLRSELKLKSDIRPSFFCEPLKHICPLKDEIQRRGMDIVVVRDIAGGMFASKGENAKLMNVRSAWDVENYDEEVIRDSARLAFEIARNRRSHVTSLDKAILLSSSVLWRQIMEETQQEYPDVTLEHMLVDHAAFQLITHPEKFDVIVASNVFGDIIADEIAGLTGAGEILPGASLNQKGQGLYVPNQLHRELETQAGKNIANPLGMILAAGMMLDYSFHLKREAKALMEAVQEVLNEGNATGDYWTKGKRLLTTKEMGSEVMKKIR